MTGTAAAFLGFNAAAFGLTLLGGAAPFARGLFSRRGLTRLFSLRSGILVAAVFLDILPEARGLDPAVAGWGGVAAFGLLFASQSFLVLDSCPEYLEECRVHLLGWTALAAIFLHSFVDGLNLTVSFSAGALAGTAVGVALALHKLADGFTLTSLLGQSGYSRRAALAALGAIALATPLGSALSWAWLATLSGARAQGVMAGLLGFSGGALLYIGAADILPRLHKGEDKANFAFFGAGLAVVAALEAL